MTRKTILPVGLLAAGVAFLCTTPTQGQTVRYFSPKVEAIVSINLEQIWASKLVKDHQALFNQVQGMVGAQVQQNDEVVELQKALGIDPIKDISAVSVGFSDLGKKPKEVLVVMEGKFDEQKFADTAKLATKKHPGIIKTLSMGNYTAYEITPPNSNEAFYVSLLNKRTLFVAKTKDEMREAIKRAGSIRPQVLKQEMTIAMKQADLKESFNFVATSDVLMEAVKQSNNPQAQVLGQMLRDLKGVNLSANVADDVKFKLGVVARNEQAAKKLADDTTQALAGFGFILANQAQNNPQFAPALDIFKTLRAASNGSAMTVRGNVSRQVIDNAIMSLENFLP